MKRFAWLLLAMPVALFALGCENKTDEGNEEQPTEPKIETGEPMEAPPTGETGNGETGNGETDNKPAEEKPAGENGDAGTPTPDKDAPQSKGTDGAGTDNPDASKVDIEAPKNPKQ